MAHCPFDKLEDMSTALEKIRLFPLLKEVKPGIFYLKGQSFLHFHIKGERRWADARDGQDWGEEIDLPFNSSKTALQNFVKEIKRRYDSQLK